MPIVSEGEHCSMKSNGFDQFKQHLNGTNDAQNFPPGMIASDEMPECSLCEKTFNSFKDFEAHSISLEHVQKVLEQNLINSFSDTNNTLTSPQNQCENMCVDKIDKQEEQEKNPSSSKTDDVLLENKAIKLPVSPYSCSTCITNFNGPVPYKQHLESESHKKKVQLEINKMKIIDGVIFCDICKVGCTGEKPYKEHLMSKKHRMTEQRLEFLKENPDENPAPKAKKMKVESTLEKDKQYFCEICKVSCSGYIPYSQHLAGNPHKKNVARSQAGGKIEPCINQPDPHLSVDSNTNRVSIAADNVSDLACSDNISDVSPTLEKIRAEKEESKMEIDESKPAWYCSLCYVQSNGPADFSQHLGGKSHRKKFEMYQKGNGFNKDKDSTDFCGTKTNNLTEGSSCCAQNKNMCSENIDYERELKKTVKVFSPDEEINFD